MEKLKKFAGILITVVLVAGSLCGIVCMTINNHIVKTERDNVIYSQTSDNFSPSEEELAEFKDFDADCIIVLGAGIRDKETPTPMLADRLDTGIALYKAKAAPKLLLTGDNGTVTHNEIHVMLNYAAKAGVPEEDIFCDHAGFSTYDSMYRAKEIFGVKKAILVTQTYHEYRTLYIGEKLGIEVTGVASDQEKYSGQPVREIREVMARVKDFFKTKAKPEAMLLGEKIPLTCDAEITHGE